MSSSFERENVQQFHIPLKTRRGVICYNTCYSYRNLFLVSDSLNSSLIQFEFPPVFHVNLLFFLGKSNLWIFIFFLRSASKQKGSQIQTLYQAFDAFWRCCLKNLDLKSDLGTDDFPPSPEGFRIQISLKSHKNFYEVQERKIHEQRNKFFLRIWSSEEKAR